MKIFRVKWYSDPNLGWGDLGTKRLLLAETREQAIEKNGGYNMDYGVNEVSVEWLVDEIIKMEEEIDDLQKLVRQAKDCLLYKEG